MISRITFSLLVLVFTNRLHAQNAAAEPSETDPIQAAIRAFNNRAPEKPNEVTVVLPPPEDRKDDPKDSDDKTPVLVTGTPPPDSSLVESDAPKPEEVAEPEIEKRGLNVRVATIDGGKGKIDPSKVRLLFPFPPKPLSEAPKGWLIEPSDTAPPFTRQVELSSGKKIPLTIQPHILVPDANGADIFAISEPGFENSLGYTQETTVAATLYNSIESLDQDIQNLGQVIDQLDQLLVSLPKAENTVESESENPKPEEP